MTDSQGHEAVAQPRTASGVLFFDEAGVIAEVTGFLGVYTNPNRITAYTDGEIRQ
ncbi:hypothetical protein P3T39_000575 [Kitasatospora sp. GP82]|nr:hypothetical protein [Kitasatospora sp. GP82]MDH6123650.1 hypothetical protein [Kitasatospora sp. GP82]